MIRLFMLEKIKLFLRNPTPLDKQQSERAKNHRRIQDIEKYIKSIEPAMQPSRTGEVKRPILFFITSTNTENLGLASAVDLLTAWSLRAAGHSVRYYACQQTLALCVHGTQRDGKTVAPPPCDSCTQLRHQVYAPHLTTGIASRPDIMATVRKELAPYSWEQLQTYAYRGLPLGQICMSSLRWIERGYDLDANHFRRHTLTEYIASAAALAAALEEELQTLNPSTMVIFNGSFYPEATARLVALSKGIKVVTHEGGHGSVSAFFSHGLATDYHIDIPTEFQMTPEMEHQLDRYLENRFSGIFKMAGRPIWPEMNELPADLKEKIRNHRQCVTVFTNVIWDTSQLSANIYFENMFEWLDETLKMAQLNPDTLFIVRAHPDELRPGKPTNQTVEKFFRSRGYDNISNVYFIAPRNFVSSYELVGVSKFCIVYNSTIGMEIAMLGKRVIPGGRPRYFNAGLYPKIESKNDYLEQLKALLDAPTIECDPQWIRNARRYFYFSIFKASLDFSPFLTNELYFKDFDIDELVVRAHSSLGTIVNGITKGTDFFAPDR